MWGVREEDHSESHVLELRRSSLYLLGQRETVSLKSITATSATHSVSLSQIAKHKVNVQKCESNAAVACDGM